MKYHRKIIIPILLFFFLLAACSTGAKKFNPHAILIEDLHNRDASWLVWSPDGRYIAISYGSSSMNASDQYSAIYVLDVFTKNSRLIIQGVAQTLAQSWSPDNEELLFYSVGGEYSQGIWRVRLDGTVPPSFVAEGRSSAWSKSGKIAILSIKHRDLSLSILAPGSQWEEMVFQKVGKSIDSLSWSPDSTKLVFSMNNHEQGDDENLFVVDLTTKKLVQLTTSSWNTLPAWSTTADLIVYDKYQPSEYAFSLFITNSEGTCEINIPGTVDAWSPSWSPDGTKIAFIDTVGKIYSLDLTQVFGSDFISKGLVCPADPP